MGETIEYVTGSAAGVGGCLLLQESCVCKNAEKKSVSKKQEGKKPEDGKYVDRNLSRLPVAFAVVIRSGNSKAYVEAEAGKIRDAVENMCESDEIKEAEKKLSDWFQNRFVRQLSRLHSPQEKVEKLLLQAGEYVQNLLEGFNYSGCICVGNMVFFVGSGDLCGAYYVAEQFGRERLSCVDIDEDNLVEVSDSTEILFTDVKIEEDVFYKNAIAEALARQKDKTFSNFNLSENLSVGKNDKKDEQKMDLFLNEIIQTNNLKCLAAVGIRFIYESRKAMYE